MTEAARRRRLSRGALRALAWIAGGAAFAAPFVSLTVSPKPATAAGSDEAQGRRVIVIRKITRRVIVRQAPDPTVQYVYVGGGSSSGSSSSASAGAAPAPAPATTSTGGS